MKGWDITTHDIDRKFLISQSPNFREIQPTLLRTSSKQLSRKFKTTALLRIPHCVSTPSRDYLDLMSNGSSKVQEPKDSTRCWTVSKTRLHTSRVTSVTLINRSQWYLLGKPTAPSCLQEVTDKDSVPSSNRMDKPRPTPRCPKRQGQECPTEGRLCRA